MSYDLVALRVPPGVSAQAYYEDEAREEAAIRDHPLPNAEERAAMERLAAAVHAVDPTAERHDSDDWIQFTTADAVQIGLARDEAGITVPYWHEGEEADAALARMHEYAAVLTRHGGYTVYDPQIEEVVSGPGAGHAYEAGVEATKQIAARHASAPPPAPERRRWWPFGRP